MTLPDLLILLVALALVLTGAILRDIADEVRASRAWRRAARRTGLPVAKLHGASVVAALRAKRSKRP